MPAKVLINANAVVNIIFVSNIAFLIVLLCPSPSESGFFDGDFLLGWQCWDNIKFVSELEQPNANRKICLDKKKLHINSMRSEIYAGWFSDDKGKHEYAIKKYKNAELAYTNSVEIFSRIKEIPNEDERRLLINAVAWGHIEGNNEEAVIVMEMAGQDLDSYLWKNGPNFSDDQGIRAMIRLLAQPLNVLHREVGVHLDVKPANFLLAKDKTGNAFLKLNDFDGSHAFEADVPKDERANAGVIFKRPLLMHTADYSSPDLYKAYQVHGLTVSMVTTKSDIWSLGMSIYDVLLLQQRYRLDNKQYERMHRFMVELFREQRFNNPANHGKDLKWLLYNLDSFKVLLKIRKEFPETFQLLNTLLNPDPAARMSARGVMKYTEGRCRPNVLAQVRGNVVIFDDTMASSLLNIELPRDGTDLNTMLEKLKRLLEKSISKSKHEQQQEETELANNNDGLPKLLPECQTN